MADGDASESESEGATPRTTPSAEDKDAAADPAAMAAPLMPGEAATLPAEGAQDQMPAHGKAARIAKADGSADAQARTEAIAQAAGKTAPAAEGAGETRMAALAATSASAKATGAATAAAGQPGSAPANANAHANIANINADAGTSADGETADTGPERDSSLAALLSAARKTGGEQPGAAATGEPFKAIMQALPPDVQSRIGVQDIAAGQGVGRTASTGELLGNQIIDMGVSGQWIDRMAREIATLSEGTGHSRFQLMPPNLGRIQVDLWQGGGQTNVRLLTETDEAAQRLREGQSALESHARLASLSLGSVSVEKAPNGSAADQNRDQGANAQQRQQAEAGGDAQQQASAQDQAGRGRSGAAGGRDGRAAAMGTDPQGTSDAGTRGPRPTDPRVRFA